MKRIKPEPPRNLGGADKTQGLQLLSIETESDEYCILVNKTK